MPQAKRLLLSPWGVLTLAAVALLVTIGASVTSARDYFHSRSTTFAATAAANPTGTDTIKDAPQRWASALQGTGGVTMTVTSSRGFTWVLAGTPSGDTRILTGDNTSPEWIFTESGNYARLGVNELLTHRDSLNSLGKSTAAWTDAARGTAMWSTRASTLNIAAGINELSSVADATLTRDPGISWTLPCTRWATTRWALWEPYGDTCNVTVTLTRDGTPAQIRSSDGMHHATWTISEWGVPVIPNPAPEQVITLSDINRLTSASTSPIRDTPPPPPTPEPSP